MLVVDSGDSPVQAITAELRSTGILYTRVNPADANRPTIDAIFLSDTVGGTPRARYQGVVLPNEAPFIPGSAEQSALETYERTYGIPQVAVYTWAHPGVGLGYTSEGGRAGSLDGREATVTDGGRASRFGYLDGRFAFENNSASAQESYLATLLVLAHVAAALWPQAPDLDGVHLAGLLLLGAVLWTGLLLQSFGAVPGAAAVCCATAAAQTLALATHPGDPHGIGLLVYGVAAALQVGLVCGLLGRATAHR